MSLAAALEGDSCSGKSSEQSFLSGFACFQCTFPPPSPTKNEVEAAETDTGSTGATVVEREESSNIGDDDFIRELRELDEELDAACRAVRREHTRRTEAEDARAFEEGMHFPKKE